MSKFFKDRLQKLENQSKIDPLDHLTPEWRQKIIDAAYDDGMTDEEKAAVDEEIRLDCATKREANRRLKPKQRKR